MEQSIKEKEAVAETQNAPSNALNGPRHSNRVMHLIKEMWPAYLIEFIVIVLGISLTLALEDWRDASKELHLEHIYLKNLLTDVDLDIQSLQQTSAASQKIIDRGNDLLVYVRSPAGSDMSYDQMAVDVLAILGRPKFLSNDATFSDLKSSGSLHLITDIQLKKLLFTYYNWVQDIRNDQDAEQQATIALSGSYFLKAFPMAGVGNHTDFSKNMEFGNNVLLRVTTRQELLDIYRKASSSAKELEKALTEVVSHQ